LPFLEPVHTDILPGILEALLPWYRMESDERELPWRADVTPYHTWVSEIMLQQTRAAAVIPYYERFLSELPDIAALAACPEDDLMKLWQGLGYYSRARNLQKGAKLVCEEYGGKLPADYALLRKIPGIGSYTAGAIASIAFGLPQPAVDGNMLRVITRTLAWGSDVLAAKTKTALEQLLTPLYPSGRDAGDLNQAFMDLGATICLPHGEPHCSHCPLARLCLAHAQGTEQDYPKKKAKAKRRIEHLTILKLCAGRAFAIRKRPETGLLAGLWELPNLPGTLSRTDVQDVLEQHGLSAAKITALPPAKHIFSHVEWRMTAYAVQLETDSPQVAETPSDGLRFISPEQAAESYSIPSAFQYFLHEIE